MSVVDEIMELSKPRRPERYRRYLESLSATVRSERLLELKQDEKRHDQLRLCFWRKPWNTDGGPI